MTMTDQGDDLERAQIERVARLAARRSIHPDPRCVEQPPRRRRRRHPAQRSRIVAASLGASTMFGIVTVLGLAGSAANESSALPPPSRPAVSPTSSSTSPSLEPQGSPAPMADVAGAAPIPAVIELTARPVVLVAAPVPASGGTAAPAPQPTPVATTRGSQ